MSNAFHQAAKALTSDPDLANKVMAASTPAERAEILKAAGVTVPSHADVNAAHASLSDVSGAGNTSTDVNAGLAAGIPAAASAVAAS